jgi:hypothetical protein
MLTIEGITLPVLTPEKEDVAIAENDLLPGEAQVTGTGKLVITNTGGSSASEGGMGSGSEDDREKGSLTKPGEKSGSASADDEDDTTFDPIKKGAKEAEKARDKE